VANGVCAEDCLGSTVGICPVAFIVKGGGLSEGTCASLGFTKEGGSISQKAGPCGTLTFKTYTKPGVSADADGCTTYNKVANGVCAEDCLGSTVGICPVAFIVKGGGLSEGTCASLGFTKEGGSISQKAGPCGTLTFKTYTKPSGPVAGALPSTQLGADEIVLATFDGASKTTHTWTELNDPVMGGRSTGSFSLTGNGTGLFKGEVVDVPSLQAPGFIKVQTQDTSPFADISSCKSIVIRARAGASYDGYRFQFGTKRGLFCSFFSSGFKAHFAISASEDFQRVEIPIESFSDCNSDSTGEPSKLCSKDPRVCPDQKTLQDVKTIAFWGEGKAGTVDLEIKSVSAVGCSALTNDESPPPRENALTDIVLATFVPGEDTTHEWEELNDPVMGGKSTGNFSVSDSLGHFRGEVVDVPSLQAPGFIKAQTKDSIPFPDISSCKSIAINARAGEKYDGYRFQFGTKRGLFCSFFSSGFKAHFDAPVSDQIMRIEIPLSNFSDCNSDATGEPSKLCSEDPRVCPDQGTLKDVETIAIWAEGAAGTVHLDIKSIVATGCSSSADVTTEEPGFNGRNTCQGTVQKGLRYNMSGRTDDSKLPFPLADGETLANGVCCDSAYAPYAEPRFTFNRTDVNLFEALEKQEKPVTFYDSVCGIPLFRAPMNRSFEEFKAETLEHGWPSFRPAEVVAQNVKILDNGYVISKCGTHLGSNLPDEKGTRYCLDLSCVAGNSEAE